YVVEGYKNAREWLQSDCHIKYILCTVPWQQENESFIKRHPEAELLITEPFELDKVTTLQTAQEVILIVEKPTVFPYQQDPYQWTLLLEKIQDPGNMGSIIRTANWFGIPHIVCSPE